MTRKVTPPASLDEVLARYASRAPDFNADVLQSFIDEFPQYGAALRRYAQVQLASVCATPEDAAREETPDHEMLPMQSKLLLRMQQLHPTPSAEEVREATRKLDAIKGRSAIDAAAAAVFGGTDGGRDALFLCVLEPPGVQDVPGWFGEKLAAHVDSGAAAVRQAVALRQAGRGRIQLQKFSAVERPMKVKARSWSEAVEQNIRDPTIQEWLLRTS